MDGDGPRSQLPGCTIAVIGEEQSKTQLVHPVLKVRVEKNAGGEILTL